MERYADGLETWVYGDIGIMRKLPRQFRLRTLLLLVVLAAVILEVYVLSRPTKPEYGSLPPQFGPRQLRLGRLIHSGDWEVSPLSRPLLEQEPSKYPRWLQSDDYTERPVPA